MSVGTSKPEGLLRVVKGIQGRIEVIKPAKPAL